ncbi:hypothetical protein A3K78_02280, partial [Candidatus Bathyarchaeota archaeon RBG_13_52_12]
MSSPPKPQILERQAWGKPVIQLLAQCKTLAENKPATIIIRHSERANIEKQSEMRTAGLTDVGMEASRCFGQLLPERRSIFVYHSPVARCRETAECILEGAKSSGIRAEARGDLRILEGPKSDWVKFGDSLIRDWPNSINYWLSGRYSSSIVELSLDYSKRASVELDAEPGPDPNALILYVAHDMPILALLFHWFGVSPNLENASFLNGFMFQKAGNKISLFL